MDARRFPYLIRRLNCSADPAHKTFLLPALSQDGSFPILASGDALTLSSARESRLTSVEHTSPHKELNYMLCRLV